MKFILLLFCFLSVSICADVDNTLIVSKLKTAKGGDFVVYEEGKSIHLLSLHHIDDRYALFEEIIAPKTQAVWKEWVLDHAPGHTSWIMLEIDLNTLQITECFSLSRNCWMALNSSESMIGQLLSLPLARVPPEERKKIGPAPIEGEDFRKIWDPPVTLEGKLIKRASTTAYATSWPEDHSPLGGKIVELYFYDQTPLPLWLQVKDASRGYFKLRSIDAGSGLISPYEDIPRRLPEFTASPEQQGKSLLFSLRLPLYYSDLHLYAIDESVENFPPIELSFEKHCKEKELYHLVVDPENLLTLHHRYRFFLTTEHPFPTCTDVLGKILWQ